MSRSSAPRRVLYIQYTNPAAYPPLEHGALLLADAGAEVLLIGTRREHDVLVVAPHARIRAVSYPFERSGWRQKVHYLRFAVITWWWSMTWRADWVYASDPLSCPIALLCGMGRRLVYHEHDSPSTTRMGLVTRLTHWARQRVARRADVCVLPNAQRVEAFISNTRATRVRMVWNCPLRREVAPAGPRPTATTLRVLYHGSIVPARLPLSVIDAMAQLPPDVELVIAGYETVGHEGYVLSLQARAKALGILSRVIVVGSLPTRAELMTLCASCHVGLAFMPMSSDDLNEQAMVGASNKPFDYMASGLALVVSDLPDWRKVFVDGGHALACDPRDASAIAAALQRLIEAPETRTAMGQRNTQMILDAWNYEATFAPVMDYLLSGDAASVENSSQAAVAH